MNKRLDRGFDDILLIINIPLLIQVKIVTRHENQKERLTQENESEEYFYMKKSLTYML